MMINFRPKKILESYREDIKSQQHTLSDNQYQEIYYVAVIMATLVHVENVEDISHHDLSS